MASLTIDARSVHALARAYVEKDWFDTFQLSGGPTNIRTLTKEKNVYILGDNADETSPLLIIDLEAVRLADAGFDPRDVFSRILAIALNQFDKSVAISPKWGPYHAGSRISIYALTAAKGSSQRIYGDTRPRGNPDVFIYSLTDGVVDIASIAPSYQVYEKARNGFIDALLEYVETPKPIDEAGTVLLDDLPEGFTTGLSLDDWYNTRLTKTQREFVDKNYSSPVRLKGSAGTGKTLSLIIKFLHDSRRFLAEQKSCRLSFITHSGATAELARSLAATLAPEVFYSKTPYLFIRIATLYEIANETLGVEYRDLNPIDLDAREGRILQYELIRDIIRDERLSLATIYGDDASPEFIKRFLSDEDRARESQNKEILNEFASVLESEGIRMGNPKAAAYLKNKREAWMMHLPLSGDRQIVLELHRKYRDILREMGVISIDQLIADFVRYLDSNQWDNLQNREGFDAIFVDELHLFNKVERMIFPELIREKGPFAPGKPIFMAYDFRQSEREYYGLDQDNDFRRSGSWIGKNFEASELVELSEVFRYTPEIANFVNDLSEPFSTFDIFDDVSLGQTANQNGSGKSHRPELREFSTNLALYNWVFLDAQRAAKSLGSGRRVAVLCLDDSLFETYCAAGQHQGAFVGIRSRDSLADIRFAGKRFIFSLPEYVAGLQFDTVYIIHIDEKTRTIGEDSPLLRRQYLSRVYLAATRASSRLMLCSSLEGGGPSKILETCSLRGSLSKSR